MELAEADRIGPQPTPKNHKTRTNTKPIHTMSAFLSVYKYSLNFEHHTSECDFEVLKKQKNKVETNTLLAVYLTKWGVP